MKVKLQKVALFIGLTFLVNYLLIFLYLALGGKWVMPQSLILGTGYMFVPMIIAIVVQKVIYRESLKEPFGISFKWNRWFIVAWLLPPVYAFLTFWISLLLPNIEYSPALEGMLERFSSMLPPEQINQMKTQVDALPINPILIALLQGLAAGISINAVAGFGEELGWRGFLQKEFGHMGFLKTSVLTGFIWGVWHAPIILQGHNYPQHPVAGVFMMIAWCILLAPIFNYIRLKSKSVIAASILHGSLNANAGLAIMVVKGGSDLVAGVTGLAGFITLFIINTCIFIFDHFLSKEPVIFITQPGTGNR